MQSRFETTDQRDLRHTLDASEHDAWLAYRRSKYGPGAPDLCCQPTAQVHPLLTLPVLAEVLATAA